MRPYLKSPHTTPLKKLKQNIQSNNSNKKGEKITGFIMTS